MQRRRKTKRTEVNARVHVNEQTFILLFYCTNVFVLRSDFYLRLELWDEFFKSLVVRLLGVFQVVLRAPKLFRTCETSSAYDNDLVDLQRRLRFFMNIDYKLEPIADKYVKGFRVNNVCTLFSDKSENKEIGTMQQKSRHTDFLS